MATPKIQGTSLANPPVGTADLGRMNFPEDSPSTTQERVLVAQAKEKKGFLERTREKAAEKMNKAEEFMDRKVAPKLEKGIEKIEKITGQDSAPNDPEKDKSKPSSTKTNESTSTESAQTDESNGPTDGNNHRGKTFREVLDNPVLRAATNFIPGGRNIREIQGGVERVVSIVDAIKELKAVREENLKQMNSDFKTLDPESQKELRGTPEDPEVYKLLTDIQIQQLEKVEKNPEIVDQKEFKAQTSTQAGQSIAIIPGGKMKPEAAEAYNKMYAAAKADGITLVVSSSLRTYQEQEALYAKYKGIQPVAVPGTSQHEVGNAVDLSTAKGTNAAYRWLKENAQDYGFYRTVPKEPWHWEHDPKSSRIMAKGSY